MINRFPHTGTITTSAQHRLGTVTPASAFRVIAKYTRTGSVTMGTETFSVTGAGQRLTVGSFSAIPTLSSTNGAIFYATDLKGNILMLDTVTIIRCRVENELKVFGTLGVNLTQSTAHAFIPNMTVAVGDTFTYGGEANRIVAIESLLGLSAIDHLVIYY